MLMHGALMVFAYLYSRPKSEILYTNTHTRMKRIVLILMCLMIVTFAAQAQTSTTDITDQYLTNPSFEADDTSGLTQVTNSSDGLRGWTLDAPTGWTLASSIANSTAVTSLLVDADCYTDNNFGQVTSLADGAYAYYLRMGWDTGTTTLLQSINLPAGQYQLTVDQRAVYANSATSTMTLTAGSASKTVSFSAGSTGIFATKDWTTSSVYLVLDEAATVSVGICVEWQSGGSCIMVDNVRLYSVEGDIVEEAEPTEDDVDSPTEGVITNDFVDETTMMSDLLQMLANFATYMKADFQICTSVNSDGDSCGCFAGENTMGSNEQGVRPNADLSMVCAFLVKYAQGKVTLPDGVTWDDLESMALQSLVFAYSTHKANRLMTCSGGDYWGSTSTSDYTWESSLWAMSVAYSAFFQWAKLTDAQKGYVEALLKAECNYELYRSIPTGYSGDTKAEENGWEADVLAVTLALFPEDDLAEKWFKRLRQFAINSYSHTSDASDDTVIDPDYDDTTVADLYEGQNLYSDYTLQNHNLFHTSYQNVVQQELGEAALALKLMQQDLYGEEKWTTNALMHNVQEVMDSVLYLLALADGELSMPNGNDWSLFLFDQITSYATVACFLRDPHSLLLENLAYKFIQARQTTTSDGSWLLNADVGARRMGVEAHRVMMTWLMHHVLSTADLTPTSWDDFNAEYMPANWFTTQQIARGSSDYRFACFSFSSGLTSYTGYFTANSVDKNKIIVPYRANNTGNYIGWYTVNGQSTNASVSTVNHTLQDNAFTINANFTCNGSTLNNRTAIYATEGNPVIQLDHVMATDAITVTKEQGGLLAISTDPFTKETRTLYYADGDTIRHSQSDGTTGIDMASEWVNIDNQVGVVSPGTSGMYFGDRALNNSIYTSKLYAGYSTASADYAKNDTIAKRTFIYYSLVTAEQTKALAERVITLPVLTKGWRGVIAPEVDGSYYLLLTNLRNSSSTLACTLSGITTEWGAPVFSNATTIVNDSATASFTSAMQRSIAQPLRQFVQADAVTATATDSLSANALLLQSNLDTDQEVTVTFILTTGEVLTQTFTLGAACQLIVYEDNSTLQVSEAVYLGIDSLKDNNSIPFASAAIYSLSGVMMAASADEKLLGQMPSGVYVFQGRTYLVR